MDLCLILAIVVLVLLAYLFLTKPTEKLEPTFGGYTMPYEKPEGDDGSGYTAVR